jgi:hypothetical protein
MYGLLKQGGHEDTVLWDVTPCSVVEIYPAIQGHLLSPSSVLRPKGGGSTCMWDVTTLLPDYTVMYTNDINIHTSRCEDLKYDCDEQRK